MLPLFILVPIVTLATADAAPPPRCEGDTDRQVEQCLEAKLAKADTAWTRYADAALKRIHAEPDTPSMIASAFAKSDKAFRAYRDAECAAVEDNAGGTSRMAVTLECRLRLAQLRTHIIWVQWLTYVDATPPLLPEPLVEARP